MQGCPQCIKPMISETPASIHIPNLRELYMKAHARDQSAFTISNTVVDKIVNWSLRFPPLGEHLLQDPLP